MMIRLLSLWLVLFAVMSMMATTDGAYVVDWEAKGSTFFDKFNFMTNDDYSHGFVNYVDRSTAQARGLISVSGNSVKLRTDTKNVIPANSRGRDSVRIESKTKFNKGLFIADIAHMPTGCGTWPAWWTYGPSWPNYGEIDIVEGVHRSIKDAATLHTNAGCTMAGLNTSQTMTGTYTSPNCDTSVGSGCGVEAPANSFGAPFNAGGGGVYAMEWTSTFIRVWYFNRTRIPADIPAGSPNPNNWSKPFAYFTLGTNCNENHFRNHTMVINLTFCGDWAGNSWVWGSDSTCASKAATCVDFVRNNPAAFDQAYWVFNYVRVYRQTTSAREV